MSVVKIALITGANSGIGYGLAQRLLDHSAKNPNEQFKVVLACRNLTRAANAQNALLKEFTEGLVEIVIVDLSSVKSVLECCKVIKERFNRIDLFFCNAGILSCEYINWHSVAKQCFYDPIALLSTSDAVVQPVGITTAEGLGETFACNVFGHYVMIKELESLLIRTNGSRIIWSSSHTATKECFSLEDYQANKTKIPYESSKRVIDLIGIGFNSRLNRHNIYSFITHPGVASTNIYQGYVNWIMQYGLEIAFYTARTLGMRIQTITNWNGSYANYYVATQPIESLNANRKYGSYCNFLGKVYTDVEDVEYDELETEALINKLDTLLGYFRDKYNIELNLNHKNYV